MRALLIATLLLLPLAAAQIPSSDFAINANGPSMLAPMAETTYNLTIDLGCAEVLENSGEADVSVTLIDAPEGITAAAASVSFGLMDCLGEESVTKTTTISVSAGETAHGLEPFTLTFEAALGDHTVTSGVPDVFVDYLPGHTMTPDGDQVFQVDGEQYAFDMVLEFTANAKTMVMFEDKNVSGSAGLTGLKAQIVDVETTKSLTNEIIFTAPEGYWTEETVSFYTYSHCLDGDDCGENFGRTVTWTFQNANPQESLATEDGEKSTPGLGLLPLLGALGFAARRK